MDALNEVTIFWFIALGLIVGTLFGVVIKKEGIPLTGNLIWGVIGSVLTGTIAIMLGLGDGLLYAFIGTLAILFLVNVFHQHHEEDVLGHVDKEIQISSGANKS